MEVSESKANQALERFREAERLSELGFRERAVEALHLSAELAVDELADRNQVEFERGQSPHEARARAAQSLRMAGALPAGFDNLLRRLNEDRKRTKYDNRSTRFDPLTLAQAQASVRIVLESLIPGGVVEPAVEEPAAPEPPVSEPAPAEAPPAPPPAPGRPQRPLWLYAAAAGVLIIAIAVAVVVGTGGGENKATTTPRPTAKPAVPYNARASLAGLTYRVLSARTGKVLDFQPRRVSKRGVFVLVYAAVNNPTDRILPLRFDAFHLKTARGKPVSTALGLPEFTAPVRPGQRERLPLPFDVPVDQVRGAVLLVDRTTANGDHRSRGLTMDLGLRDGLGELMPSDWRGRTSNGRPLTMRVERGDVVTRMTVSGGKTCDVKYKGAAFVEDGAFKLGSDPDVSGRFSTSSAAAGQITGGSCGKLGWRASTSLR